MQRVLHISSPVEGTLVYIMFKHGNMDRSENSPSCRRAGHIPDVDGGVGEEGHVGGELAPEPVSRERRAQPHHFTSVYIKPILNRTMPKEHIFW